ncbi:hypothetical protein TUSST3_29880 [Streptomyces sp. TUS-ST3]|jgi:WD40 repeat protein|uniref:WD40 repeat domain-containing protein n=1 Tax=Streptomyces sp. TUS-ST3 TaxID=3025591 RepID=UPI00235B358B|nr:hypothetical protein [Streptomyces sp. TUS-ST3]GLP66368.1 hypothetical protein TUSST3_29880 [Streptomyces sp. TUS-ST3]
MNDSLALLAWCDPARRHVRWTWSGIWVGVLLVDRHRVVYRVGDEEKFSAPLDRTRFAWRGGSRMTAARFDLHLPETTFRLYLSPPGNDAPQPDRNLVDHLAGALDRLSIVSLFEGTLGTLGNASGMLGNALTLPGAVAQLRDGHRAAERLRAHLAETMSPPDPEARAASTPEPCFTRGDDHTWATAVRFSPGGETIACAHSDGSVRLWNTRDGTPRRRLHPLGHGVALQDIAYVGAGRVLLTAGDDRCARLWDVLAGEELARLAHPDAVSRVTVDAGNRWAATVSEDMTARIWDLTTGGLLRTLDVDCAHGVLFAATGSDLVVSGVGGDISRFPSPTAACSGRTETGTGVVDCLAFSDDGRLAVNDSEESAVTVFDSALDHAVAELQNDTPVLCGAFSPTGRSFLGGDEKGDAVLWDIRTGRRLLTLAHGSPVESLDWNRRTGLIATGTLEGLTVWDLRGHPAFLEPSQ